MAPPNDDLVALAIAQQRGAIEELVRDRVREAVDYAAVLAARGF